MVMVYNTAKVSLEAQTHQSHPVSIETFRAAFKEGRMSESFITNVAIKPMLRKDVHNITTGVAGIGETSRD